MAFKDILVDQLAGGDQMGVGAPRTRKREGRCLICIDQFCIDQSSFDPILTLFPEAHRGEHLSCQRQHVREQDTPVRAKLQSGKRSAAEPVMGLTVRPGLIISTTTVRNEDHTMARGYRMPNPKHVWPTCSPMKNGQACPVRGEAVSKTIVWIDDDTEIIDAVVRPLERVGYRVIRFHTASEALAAIDQLGSADLLLMEMIFPPSLSPPPPHRAQGFDRYTGLRLLRTLREVYHMTTPVVALTVVMCDDLDRDLRALGGADIIHKPVRPSELKQRIDAVWAAWPQPRKRGATCDTVSVA